MTVEPDSIIPESHRAVQVSLRNVIVPDEPLISDVATAFIPTRANIPVSEAGVFRKMKRMTNGLKTVKLRTEMRAKTTKGIAALELKD
jgi:hypothetical protein